MKKSFNNPFINPDKAGQTVRKIAAQAVIFMLFLTAISCEKTEKDIEFNPEIHSGYLYVFYGEGEGHPCIMLDRIPLTSFVGRDFLTPISYPHEFQFHRDMLQVYATYRIATGSSRMGRCGIYIEILSIEERIFTSRFVVRKIEDCGFLLVEDLGDAVPIVYNPKKLPEEFQKDGLRVDVTFHRRRRGGELVCNIITREMKIITIMETPEKSLSAETRITGGSNTTIENNPWQVLFYVYNHEGRRSICGGTIVAPNLILTAKHCLRCRDTHEWFSLDGMRIHAGITRREDANNSNRFNVRYFIPHPYPNVDVALLRLERNIPFNNNRRAINFLSTNSAAYNVGNLVRATGWGRTRQGWENQDSHADRLQTVDLRIISNQYASIRLNEHRGWERGRNLEDHQMAAIGAAGAGHARQGACGGDSGGPLTTQTAAGKVLIGVIQEGIMDCEGTNQDSPSVFVRTSSIADWLIRFVPPVISGPAAVCPGVTNAVFSIPPLPTGVTVRWEADFPLSIPGDNNQNIVTIEHSGATTPTNSQVRAIISLNGQVITVQRNVVVNRPTITSITQVNSAGQALPGTTVHTGSSLLFRVNHNSPGAHVTWSVSPSYSVPISFWDANTLNVGFTFPGGYMITATVTNACGTHTMSKNITAIRPPTILPPTATCIYCGTTYTNMPGCARCPRTEMPGLLREPNEPLIEKEQTN